MELLRPIRGRWTVISVPMTEAAVKAYQQDRGVHVDGIVGDQTWWAPSGAAGATLASLSELTTV